MKRRLSCLMVLAVSAACGPSIDYRRGDVLISEDFSDSKDWGPRDGPDGDRWEIRNGRYHAQVFPGGIMWVLNWVEHDDVVIEVEAHQFSEDDNNAYGVVCRSDRQGDGYYFLISGDEFYSIARGVGRNIEPLVEWERAAATINVGASTNRIRAVCIGNYLGLWVNDTFLGETRDSAYTRGYTGFAAGIFEGEDIEVGFDDLRISEALPEED